MNWSQLGRMYERVWYAVRPERVKAVVRRRPPAGGPLHAVSDREFVAGTYRFLLQRDPDRDGLENYLRHLRGGTHTRETMLGEVRGLDEFWFKFARLYHDPLLALHRSRCLFVETFPKAARILDIGGTHQQSREGALVLLGYPYEFDLLSVVDLPVEDRHELYRQIGEVDREDSRLGPVEYHYRTMTDLSIFPDGEFDLVYSGQSIEHVTETEADTCLEEVRRVLRPGGALCLDTPNRLASDLQCQGTGERFVNPDHKIEYADAELRAKLEAHRLAVREAKGLVSLPESFRTGKFHPEELAENTGVFAEIGECSLLAYICEAV